MKKMFSIKKISIALFTFLCMFLTTNNVKAAGKYVCYYLEDVLISPESHEYVDPDNTTFVTSNQSKIYIQMTYENGKASFKFYDDKTGTTHSRLVDVEYYGEENMINYISPDSGKQIIDADFSVGCPTIIHRIAAYPGKAEGIIYDIFKEGTEEYKQFSSTKMKDSIWVKNDMFLTTQNSTSYCTSYEDICYKLRAEQLTGTIEDDGSGSGGGASGTEDSNLLTCAYASDDHVATDHAGNVTQYFTIKYNKTTGETALSSPLASDQSKVAIKFDMSTLGGKCPEAVWTDAFYEEYYLTKQEVPDQGNTHKFGIIKYLNLNEIEKNAGKSGCNLLGENTVKYLRLAMNLIRFLIPVIIIVMSIIDFVGVVLSGEDEKMTKAKKNFAIRLLVGFLLLIVPALLELLLKMVGIIEKDLTDIVCNIL